MLAYKLKKSPNWIVLGILFLILALFLSSFALGVLLILLVFLIMKNPLVGFILFIFVLPLRVVTWTGLGFHFRLTYFFFGLTFLAYLLHKVKAKNIRFSRTPLDFPILLFIFIALISIIQTKYVPSGAAILGDSLKNLPWLRTLTRIIQLCFFITIFYFSVDFIKNLITVKKIIYALMISTTLYSLYGIYGVFTKFIDFLPKLAISPFTAYTTELPRIKSLEAEPLFFGIYLLTILPVFVALMFSKKEFINKKLLLTVILINFVAFIFTYSRAAWLGMLVALSLILFLNRRLILRKKLLLLYIFSLPLAFFVLVSISPVGEKIATDVFIKPIEGAFDTTAGKFWSTRLRLITMAAGLKFFSEHPILGIGYDNFIFHYGARFYEGLVPHSLALPETNNFIIDILAELGILGFAIMFWLVVIILKSLIKAIQSSKDPVLKSLLIGYLASFIGVGASSLFFSSITFSYLWLLLGMMFAIINISSSKLN